MTAACCPPRAVWAPLDRPIGTVITHDDYCGSLARGTLVGTWTWVPGRNVWQRTG